MPLSVSAADEYSTASAEPALDKKGLTGQAVYSEPVSSPADIIHSFSAAHERAHQRAQQTRQSDIIARTAIAFSPAYSLDQTVFASIEGIGFFKSTDNGFSWTPIGEEMSGLDITALVLSPDYEQDQILYAGTWGGGIFSSLDGGESWAPVNDGIEYLDITSVVISPEYIVDSTIVAATRDGEMYKSINGAVSWINIGRPPRRLSGQTNIHYRKLGISPNYGLDQMLFLSTFEGFWNSKDGGSSWNYSEVLPSYLVRSLSVSPNYSQDQSVVASTYGGGMINSDDACQTWETGNTGLLNEYPDPTDSAAFATNPVIMSGTVWAPQISLDGGQSWYIEMVLMKPVFPRAVVLSPDFSSDYIIAVGVDNAETGNPKWAWYEGGIVSTNGVFLSGNGGLTWLPTYLNGIGIHSVAFSPDYTNDQTMFAGSLYTGLYKSLDGGIAWDPLDTGPTDCCLTRVALSPYYAIDQTLFIARPTGVTALRGLYKSTDGGLTWSKTAGSEDVTLLDLVISPNFLNDGAIFIATLEKGVLKSTDGGNSLMPTNLTDAYVTALDISPDFENDATVFAATYNGIYKSEDAGHSWLLTTYKTRHEETRPNVVKYGLWTWVQDFGASSSYVAFSDRPGDAAAFSFTGTGTTFLGVKGPNYGMVDIILDGEWVDRVDLYDPDRLLQQVLFEATGLEFGEHTLTIIITDNHNPLSGGTWVSVDAFDVWL